MLYIRGPCYTLGVTYNGILYIRGNVIHLGVMLYIRG